MRVYHRQVTYSNVGATNEDMAAVFASFSSSSAIDFYNEHGPGADETHNSIWFKWVPPTAAHFSLRASVASGRCASIRSWREAVGDAYLSRV